MKYIEGYYIDVDDYERLCGIKRTLFGDGTHLTPDKRRDLANSLDCVLSGLIPQYDEG